MTADSSAHWEKIYAAKTPDAVSWYRPHLDTSLDFIRRIAPDPASSVIDVGGGEATLVDDLLASGYRDVTVLDISSHAIEFARNRLEKQGLRATWMVGDITSADLPPLRYDVWHDRAVFHFLTKGQDRRAYVRQVARSVKRGGHVLVATFGPQGPERCSGLKVVRYDAGALHAQFGTGFRMIGSRTELHETPFGTVQQFMYCLCQMG